MNNDKDRELLELAAKAAGIKNFTYLGGLHGLTVRNADGSGTPWNPLADDGDALRLAIKLRLNFSDCGLWLEHNDMEHYDPYAATRRVIVKAAAERLQPPLSQDDADSFNCHDCGHGWNAIDETERPRKECPVCGSQRTDVPPAVL